jgi:hypothetical protein
LTVDRIVAFLVAPPWVGSAASRGPLPDELGWVIAAIGAWTLVAGARSVSTARRLAEVATGALFGVAAAQVFDPYLQPGVLGPGVLSATDSAARTAAVALTCTGWAMLSAAAFAYVGRTSRRFGLALVGGVVASLLVDALPELGGPGVVRTSAAIAGMAVTPWTFEVFPAAECALVGAALFVAGVGGDPGRASTFALAAAGMGMHWMLYDRLPPSGTPRGGPTGADTLLVASNRQD